ncbi:MAG: M23 family metallopeptidase, partial [Legionellales bacterium]|nr:M23 family metallopeptidase [Legionellales bacterium]
MNKIIIKISLSFWLILFSCFGFSSIHLALGSKNVVNGGVSYFRISVTDENVKDIKVMFQNEEIALIRRGEQNFIGFIGVDYDLEPGEYPIIVIWNKNNKNFSNSYNIIVEEGNYRATKLSVDISKVILNDDDKRRADEEKQMIIAQIYGQPHMEPYFNSKFKIPLQSKVTSPYGVKRVFNGKKKSHHTGVDYRAAVGTKIKAINRGVVRLTKNLFYGGNVIILDHGNKMFSSYSHLSSFNVKVGEIVEKDQLIGLSGDTGRVTAPHLHLGARLNGVGVNPEEFIE